MLHSCEEQWYKTFSNIPWSEKKNGEQNTASSLLPLTAKAVCLEPSGLACATHCVRLRGCLTLVPHLHDLSSGDNSSVYLTELIQQERLAYSWVLASYLYKQKEALTCSLIYELNVIGKRLKNLPSGTELGVGEIFIFIFIYFYIFYFITEWKCLSSKQMKTGKT